jgi:uncharacterized phage protein (TIGR02218 family)
VAGFSLFEISNFLGRPVCLYEMAWGGQIWRYTSADRDVEYPTGSGTMWTAIPISDNGFTLGTQSEPFQVTLPRDLDVCQLFVGTPPSTPITLTARRFHRDDTDNEATVYWVGTIGSIKGLDPAKSQINGLSISQTIRRTGNRVGWEVNCPHALFDAGCRADKAAFAQATTITAIAGNVITVAGIKAALADANYAGGFIEWDATGLGSTDRRPIDSTVGVHQFALLGRADRLIVGQDVTIYPGCDLSAEMCETVFDNLANHGGFGFMSKKSPFDGNPVY